MRPPAVEPEGCLCGAVLRGIRLPTDCGLFGKQCTPTSPVGACMVSSEGACAAYFKYGKRGRTEANEGNEDALAARGRVRASREHELR